jgi:anti-anti-sigma factor
MSARQYFATRPEPGLLVVEVLQPVGSLADDVVLQELDLVLDEVRRTLTTAVIIDFHQVAYFGSSLLESLRVLWRHVEPGGGQMILCNLSTLGREIIELAKFDHVWPIANTVAEAQQRLA